MSRRDIPLAQQAVQAAHAAMEHAYTHGRPSDYHPSYIHVTAKNKEQLDVLRTKLHQLGHLTSEFHEPYKNWGLTAVAAVVGEEHRHLFKGLQLWRLPTQEQP